MMDSMIDYEKRWFLADYAWLFLAALVVISMFLLGLLVGRHQGYWKGVSYTEAQWLAHQDSR